ncbi:MAG: hypothetical protein K0S82_73 [Gaiellaceae bacterium]|jgi:hypothetical protein|nr:hypothetical protein [Gaiellaceae bacterium]
MDLSNPMIFLSACCAGIPLLVGWVKLKIWDLRRERGLP